MPKVSDEEIPAGGGGGGNFIRHVRLRDKRESCAVRFLTEFEDFFWERFHRVMVGGQFKGMKVCVNSALGQACKPCDDGDRAGVQFLAWAYELVHDYPERPRDVRGKLKEVQAGSRTVFREEVNEPRLMRYSTMHFDVIRDRYEDYDTLLGHLFRWRRLSPAGDRQPSYMLEPIKEDKLSKELRELAASLPDLEDVALGKTESLTGEAKPQQEKPKTRKRRVTKDDEEDNEPDVMPPSTDGVDSDELFGDVDLGVGGGDTPAGDDDDGDDEI